MNVVFLLLLFLFVFLFQLFLIPTSRFFYYMYLVFFLHKLLKKKEYVIRL